MTLEELNRYNRLHDELMKNQEMLDVIKSRATSISSPSFSGMPHGSEVFSKTEMFAVEIADLEARIEYLKEEIPKEKKKVEDYCSAIQNIRLRTTMKMKFLHRMTWAEVSETLTGRYQSEYALKTMVYTYIKTQDETSPQQVENIDRFDQMCFGDTRL